MPRGWLLDVNSNRAGDAVVLWMKTEAGTIDRRVVPYAPPLFVAGPAERLDDLGRVLVDDPLVASVDLIALRTSLFEPPERRHPALAVVPSRHGLRTKVAGRIDALGGFREFTLLDVDLTVPQLFYIERHLYPFAAVVWSGNEVVATAPADAELDYALPPLSTVDLAIDVERPGPGRLPGPAAAIRSVTLGDVPLSAGDEEGTLAALVAELARQDPDVLITHGGDAFDVPHLYRRALANGFSDASFVLGREAVGFGLERTGTSFESYGRILHRAPSYPLAGRFHLDIGERFVEDVGIAGYIEMARLSRLGLQVVARRSPGTAFSSMELAIALADGVHIPWKKNFPEQEKSAATLVAADRGGFILTPPVGLFDGVDEFDFTSLYPSIMVEHNLSIETLECRCCPGSPRVAPGLGYRSCLLREGIVPKTLRPILKRRLYYKARKKATTGAERARYDDLCKAWKWVLVTSFGYQGYRNARFGRIEVHEAINAYAREILVALVDRALAEGWGVLHGIVDSLWLTPPPGADPEAFARQVSDATRHPLAYEGRYRWIVFLPNRAHGFGVPQRYYGSYAHGELKTRGIEVRRGDACAMVQAAQQEALDLLAEAPDAAGFRARILPALGIGRRYADRLAGGSWPRDELVLTHRVTKTLDEYRVFNEGVAALHQLRAIGVERAAGEEVAYVITDQHARDWRRKAVPAELMAGDEAYDAAAYVGLLARSFETLFIPFGWTVDKVLEHWGRGPPRPGYRPDEHRSCQDPRQRRLVAASG